MPTVVPAGIVLRSERPGDRRDVRELHLAAFGDHGSVVAGLVEDLRPSAPVSLVAEDGGAVVGHVLFSPALLDAPRELVPVQTPEAAFQAVLLPAHEPWMTGTFVHPDVFWRHDAVGLR